MSHITIIISSTAEPVDNVPEFAARDRVFEFHPDNSAKPNEVGKAVADMYKALTEGE